MLLDKFAKSKFYKIQYFAWSLQNALKENRKNKNLHFP